MPTFIFLCKFQTNLQIFLMYINFYILIISTQLMSLTEAHHKIVTIFSSFYKSCMLLFNQKIQQNNVSLLLSLCLQIEQLPQPRITSVKCILMLIFSILCHMTCMALGRFASTVYWYCKRCVLILLLAIFVSCIYLLANVALPPPPFF